MQRILMEIYRNGIHRVSFMFSDAYKFNGDISKWDTSDVTNMSSMLHGANSFNGDLSNWDTSNVVKGFEHHYFHVN